MRTMVALTSENQWRKIPWEVCPVKRPLLSATKLAKNGHVLTIKDKEAWIHHTQTGERSKLRREGNVWMLDLWIRKPPEREGGFTRQGP